MVGETCDVEHLTPSPAACHADRPPILQVDLGGQSDCQTARCSDWIWCLIEERGGESGRCWNRTLQHSHVQRACDGRPQACARVARNDVSLFRCTQALLCNVTLVL